MNAILIDIATAAHPNAPDWVEPGKPPSNYKRPEAIAEWQEADGIDRLAKAGLDPDLCVITCVVVKATQSTDVERIALDEEAEKALIQGVGDIIRLHAPWPIVGYNVKAFDLAVLKRRARYLGVNFPDIDLGRYRNDRVIDLCELLYPEREKRKSLDWLCKRLGYTDLMPKPLSGADEARVFETQAWELLRQSVARDVEAVRRLGVWAGVL